MTDELLTLLRRFAQGAPDGDGLCTYCGGDVGGQFEGDRYVDAVPGLPHQEDCPVPRLRSMLPKLESALEALKRIAQMAAVQTSDERDPGTAALNDMASIYVIAQEALAPK